MVMSEHVMFGYLNGFVLCANLKILFQRVLLHSRAKVRENTSCVPAYLLLIMYQLTKASLRDSYKTSTPLPANIDMCTTP